VRQPLDIAQHDHRAILRGQLVERSGQNGPELALDRWIVDGRRPVRDGRDARRTSAYGPNSGVNSDGQGKYRPAKYLLWPAAPPSTASAPPRSPRPPSSRHARTSRARSGLDVGEVQPVALALHSHDGVGPPMQELQLRRARLEGGKPRAAASVARRSGAPRYHGLSSVSDHAA
jgi:hypothetical protein